MACTTSVAPAVKYAFYLEVSPTMRINRRVRELEARYGSDVALHVRYDEDGRSWLPDGGSAAVCTDCARHVVEQEEHGRIVGWAAGSNPRQRITGRHGADGHDFAIIEDRYLIDPWAKTTAETSSRAVYDLDDPHDRAIVCELYGDPSVFVEVTARNVSSDFEALISKLQSRLTS